MPTQNVVFQSRLYEAPGQPTRITAQLNGRADNGSKLTPIPTGWEAADSNWIPATNVPGATYQTDISAATSDATAILDRSQVSFTATPVYNSSGKISYYYGTVTWPDSEAWLGVSISIDYFDSTPPVGGYKTRWITSASGGFTSLVALRRRGHYYDFEISAPGNPLLPGGTSYYPTGGDLEFSWGGEREVLPLEPAPVASGSFPNRLIASKYLPDIEDMVLMVRRRLPDGVISGWRQFKVANPQQAPAVHISDVGITVTARDTPTGIAIYRHIRATTGTQLVATLLNIRSPVIGPIVCGSASLRLMARERSTRQYRMFVSHDLGGTWDDITDDT